MDGLEATEVMYSSLNAEHRIDAEYYSREHVSLYQSVITRPHIVLGDIADITDGIHTSFDYDESSSINMISATSPRDNYFDLSRGAFISEQLHRQNPRTALKAGDVILSTVGTIGNCAVVTDDVLPANSSRSVGIIRLRSAIVSPNVLACFLLSKYGRNQSDREKTGNVQPCLFIYKIKEMIIPDFSREFQEEIERVSDQAHELRAQSARLYTQAQHLLQDAIGFRPTERENITAKSFSEVFGAGRLDAEYFMPEYDDYSRTVNNYKDGCATIGSLFTQVTERCPRTEASYRYVEIGDVDTGTGAARPNEIATEDLPDNAKIMTRKGDIVVSKVRPNRGAVAILEEDNLLVSGAFTVLREKTGYRREVLQVLLRTELYRDWLLRYNVGTSYPVIKDNDVLNMPVPLFAPDIQHGIASSIQQSFTLRHQAETLIAQAVKSVEDAIEQEE